MQGVEDLVTGTEMLAIDLAVCKGLGKRPGETLLTAASRALRGAPEAAKRRAAGILLNRSGDVWERMRRAAEVLVPGG